MNDDSQFANKIVKERKTLDSRFASKQQDCERMNLINPVTSKIEIQPLDTDTDAQLHKERVITVRKAAEIRLSSSTREIPNEMRTSWKTLRRDEVSGRDQDRAENCSDSTRAMRSTDGPDDDSQQGARPRADSSAVARFNVADLERA